MFYMYLNYDYNGSEVNNLKFIVNIDLYKLRMG